MQSAEFAVQRLRTMLPRLQKRYQQVADAEEYAAWATTFDRLKPKHSAAAAKLKTIYIEFEAKVVEALTEAKQVDAEVQVVMHRKPYHLWESNNDGRGLPTVEAAARGLTGVSSDYSLMSMKIACVQFCQSAGMAAAANPPCRASGSVNGASSRRSETIY